MSDTEQHPHTEAWSSDDLEADADNASTPQPPQDCPHDAGTQSGGNMRANVDSQAGPMQSDPNATLSSGNASGGAGSALDMSNERDRGLVRKSLANRPKRWAGVTDEVKAAVVAGLSKAMHTATVHIDNGVDPLDAAKVMASVAKTFEALEAQCQKDEHRADDMARLDNGQATQAIKLYGIGTPIDAV